MKAGLKQSDIFDLLCSTLNKTIASTHTNVFVRGCSLNECLHELPMLLDLNLSYSIGLSLHSISKDERPV